MKIFTLLPVLGLSLFVAACNKGAPREEILISPASYEAAKSDVKANSVTEVAATPRPVVKVPKYAHSQSDTDYVIWSTLNKAQVRLIQEALRGQGFKPGAVDGIYGLETSNAIRRFQKSIDGGVGPISYSTLRRLGIDI